MQEEYYEVECNEEMDLQNKVINHIFHTMFYAILMWILYDYLLFKPLMYQNEWSSRFTLIAIIIIVSIIATVLHLKEYKDIDSITYLLVAFGIYTIMTYQ